MAPADGVIVVCWPVTGNACARAEVADRPTTLSAVARNVMDLRDTPCMCCSFAVIGYPAAELFAAHGVDRAAVRERLAAGY